MARPKVITLTLQTPALNNVAQDQTTVGAGSLTLNGSLISGGVLSIPTAQQIDIESVGNISAVTFTITGTDQDGVAQTEDVTGPNNSTVTSTKYFKTITSIVVDGAVGTNTSVGITDEARSQIYPMNFRKFDFGSAEALSSLTVIISGTINYTVRILMTNPHDSTITRNWIALAALTSKTATTTSSPNIRIGAIELIINSYSAGATVGLSIMQG